ncbi:MAG: amidoligase family protein, partial [Selenomonadaceae bacterium]|nr:amidoligase family protein [Selenomonadaceae bacterium]
TYGKFTVKANDGRVWTVMSDSSIRATDTTKRCELVTPILHWSDIETLQQIVRELRHAGARVNETCGMHVHIGASDMTAAQIRHLVNMVAGREEIFCRALKVHETRRYYCAPTNERFLRELNRKKPDTLDELKKVWYGDGGRHDWHYDETRYTILNLHAFSRSKPSNFAYSTHHSTRAKSKRRFNFARRWLPSRKNHGGRVTAKSKPTTKNLQCELF